MGTNQELISKLFDGLKHLLLLSNVKEVQMDIGRTYDSNIAQVIDSQLIKFEPELAKNEISFKVNHRE